MTNVTPAPGLIDIIATGGTSVGVIQAFPNGGLIVNPLTASDQGLSVAEPLYINPTGKPAQLVGRNQTFAIQPGQTWFVVPSQSTTTFANAASSGHRFSCVVF